MRKLEISDQAIPGGPDDLSPAGREIYRRALQGAADAAIQHDRLNEVLTWLAFYGVEYRVCLVEAAIDCVFATLANHSRRDECKDRFFAIVDAMYVSTGDAKQALTDLERNRIGEAAIALSDELEHRVTDILRDAGRYFENLKNDSFGFEVSSILRTVRRSCIPHATPEALCDLVLRCVLFCYHLTSADWGLGVSSPDQGKDAILELLRAAGRITDAVSDAVKAGKLVLKDGRFVDTRGCSICESSAIRGANGLDRTRCVRLTRVLAEFPAYTRDFQQNAVDAAIIWAVGWMARHSRCGECEARFYAMIDAMYASTSHAHATMADGVTRQLFKDALNTFNHLADAAREVYRESFRYLAGLDEEAPARVIFVMLGRVLTKVMPHASPTDLRDLVRASAVFCHEARCFSSRVGSSEPRVDESLNALGVAAGETIQTVLNAVQQGRLLVIDGQIVDPNDKQA